MSPEDEAESDLEEHLRPMTPEERANYKAPTDEDIRLALAEGARIRAAEEAAQGSFVAPNLYFR